MATQVPFEISEQPCMNANATSLVHRYLHKVARVQALIDMEASQIAIDRAIAEEAEAEAALSLQVKLAAGQNPWQAVAHPVAATLDGSLVVVAPDRSGEWEEIVTVVANCHIAYAEE
jgi:hypothetical protein